MRDPRRVSAVVRICRPFLNQESISTTSSTFLRDSLLSSGSWRVTRPPIRFSVTVDLQEQLPNALHLIRGPELLEQVERA